MTRNLHRSQFQDYTFRRILADTGLSQLFVYVTLPSGRLIYLVERSGLPDFVTGDLDEAIAVYNEEI